MQRWTQRSTQRGSLGRTRTHPEGRGPCAGRQAGRLGWWVPHGAARPTHGTPRMSPREELQPPLGPWAKGTRGPEKLCSQEGREGRASAHLAVCRATVPSGGHLCTLRPPPSLRDTMPSSLAPHPAEGDFLFNYTAEFRSLLSSSGKSNKFLKALLIHNLLQSHLYNLMAQLKPRGHHWTFISLTLLSQ